MIRIDFSFMNFVNVVVKLLDEKKFSNIAIYSIKKADYPFDSIVVASGMSLRHNMIAGCDVYSRIKSIVNDDNLPHRVIFHDQNDSWVSIEVNDIIFHIMSSEAREYYDIDSLCRELVSCSSESKFIPS